MKATVKIPSQSVAAAQGMVPDVDRGPQRPVFLPTLWEMAESVETA